MQVPSCPRCSQSGNQVAMSFVPGMVSQANFEGVGSVQVRKVFCPQCSFMPADWWAPFKIKHQKCSACGHEEQTKDYIRGGPSEVPAAAPENVYVDAKGYAHGLGIQSVPLQR